MKAPEMQPLCVIAEDGTKSDAEFWEAVLERDDLAQPVHASNAYRERLIALMSNDVCAWYFPSELRSASTSLGYFPPGYSLRGWPDAVNLGDRSKYEDGKYPNEVLSQDVWQGDAREATASRIGKSTAVKEAYKYVGEGGAFTVKNDGSELAAIVHWIQEEWQGSSTDSPIMDTIDDAVVDQFGLGQKRQGGDRDQPMKAFAKAWVKAQYDVTQQWLKDRGISGEVTLYRGGDAKPSGHALVSTAASKRVAKLYGEVTTHKVHVSRIFAVPATGLGHVGEVIVLKGKHGSTSLSDDLADGMAGAALEEVPIEDVALSYREKLKVLAGDRNSSAEAVNLPDIADVSFPTMIGAIPSKPPKKKRRKVNYHGVLLARNPTDFEAKVLSLTAIPRRYDIEMARLVEELSEVRRQHLSSVLSRKDDDRSDDALAQTVSVLRETQERLAQYGIYELRNECRRQGLQLADVPEHAFHGAADVPVLAASVALIGETLHREWGAALARTRLRMLRTKRERNRVIGLMEPKIQMGLKSAARTLLHEAFGVPRSLYVQKIAAAASPGPHHLRVVDEDEAERLVDYVIQSAVMDTATCDPCEAADGMTFEYDSDEMLEYQPPYVHCLGGDACRCVQVYVLHDGGSWVVREDQII